MARVYAIVLQITETFLEAVPQLLLRLYVLIKKCTSPGGSFDSKLFRRINNSRLFLLSFSFDLAGISDMEIITVLISMAGLAGNLVGFKLVGQFVQPDKEIKDKPRLICLFIAHYFGTRKRFFFKLGIKIPHY